MRLKLEAFEPFSVLSVRGVLSPTDAHLLRVGIEKIARDALQPVVIHLGTVQLTPDQSTILMAIKAKLTKSKMNVTWISPEKALGDFPSFTTFSSRKVSGKNKLIAEKILLDDECHQVQSHIDDLNQKLHDAGADESHLKRTLAENRSLNGQMNVTKRILDWLNDRVKHQVSVAIDDPERLQTIPAQQKGIQENLEKRGIAKDLAQGGIE